jgi:hypothetical protein
VVLREDGEATEWVDRPRHLDGILELDGVHQRERLEVDLVHDVRTAAAAVAAEVGVGAVGVHEGHVDPPDVAEVEVAGPGEGLEIDLDHAGHRARIGGEHVGVPAVRGHDRALGRGTFLAGERNRVDPLEGRQIDLDHPAGEREGGGVCVRPLRVDHDRDGFALAGVQLKRPDPAEHLAA